MGLLDPHLEVAGFVGRDAELGELLAWCADGQDAPVRLVTGPAGSGKTRLAVEFAHRMRARGWRTEWLGAEDGSAIQPGNSAARIVQRKTLIVVDNAEHRDGLAEFIVDLVREQPQARLLLLARDAGGWCDQLELARPVVHALVTAARSALIELTEPVDDKLTDQATAALAAVAFAAELSLASRRVELIPADESSRHLILELHIAALLTAVSESPEPLDAGLAAAGLLSLEQDAWNKRAGELGFTAAPELLSQLVAVGLLLGASTEEAAAAAIAKVTDDKEPIALASWLHKLLGRLQEGWPSQLARRHVTAELDAAPEFGRRCLTGLDARQLRRIVPLLADVAAAPAERAGQRTPGPPESVLRLVAGQLETLRGTNAELIPILRLLPYPDAIWAGASAMICGQIVSQLPDDADQGTRAYWLNSLSARLWLAGRELEAVSAAEEAVSIRRDLAAQVPDRYLASLAVSLSYLGIQYAGLGRTDDAFKITEEAVEVRRRLAADDPDRYAPLADDQATATATASGLSAGTAEA